MGEQLTFNFTINTADNATSVQLYAQVKQEIVDFIVYNLAAVQTIRVLIFNEEKIIKEVYGYDSNFILCEGLKPFTEYTACVEFIAIRGQVISLCSLPQSTFTSAPAGLWFLQ